MVGKLAPFQKTMELAIKLEPVTVRVKARPPAVAVEGARLEIVGVAGAVMVKVTAFDGAPPGFTTLTLAEPAAAMAVAGTCAVSWVAPTKVVASGEPFHCTVALETKPLPLTVSGKAGLPDAAEPGLREEMAGGGVAMVNVRLLETDAEELATRTAAVPPVATRLAGIWAVSWVELTNVVAMGDPFHWIAVLATKAVPVTVRVKPGEPAVTKVGLMAARVGAESGETVKVSVLEAAGPTS